MLFGIFLLLLLLLLLLVQTYIPRRYLRIFKAGFKLQPLRGYIPGLGHAIRTYAVRNDIHSFMMDICKEVNDFGNTGVLWFGPVPFFVITDPEDALTVANKCINKSYLYDIGLKWNGRNLFTLNDDAWKHDRKIIAPAFNIQVLNAYLPVFNDCSREMIQSFESEVSNGYIDTFKQLNYYILDVLAKTILGVDSDLFPRESYGELIQNLMSMSIRQAAIVPYHIEAIFKKSNLYKAMTECGELFNSISQNVTLKQLKLSLKKTFCQINLTPELEIKHYIMIQLIDEKSSKYKAKSEDKKFHSFLDLLFEKYREGELSEEQVRDEVNFMVCAAYDTTLSTLTMILCKLGMHSYVQEKVYEEIRVVFGDSNRDLDKEDLKKFPYLEAVIKETLRLFPTVPVVARTVTKETQLKNTKLPEGSQVVIGLYGTQIGKHLGEDRMEFKPERWLDSDGLLKINTEFSPFSLGRRDCVGKQYVMMLLKTALIHVIRKFRIVKEIKELGFKYELVSKPVSGNKISFSIRENFK